MQRWSLLLALCAVAALAQPAGAATHPTCPTSGKTLAKNGSARVWRVHTRSGIDRYYGCAFKVGRPVRLDPKGGQAEQRPMMLTSTLVAYEVMDFNLKPFRMIVRNLKTGATVHSAPSNAQKSEMGEGGPARSVLVKRDGTVAWMASVDCFCEGVDFSEKGFEVHVIATDGKHRILDRGPEVDGSSLALAAGGSRVTWKHGTEQRSAPIT